MPVDVRVVAATNRDLRQDVHEGRFRQDLYQRLSVVEIPIPPLSERPDDIEPLALHFVKQNQSLCRSPIGSIDPAVIEALHAYRFEGNVRELQNILRYALFHKQRGDVLLLEDLPAYVLEGIGKNCGSTGLDRVTEALFDHVVRDGLSLSEVLDHCESTLLKSALRYTRGNRTATASLLKVNQRTFYNKMRQHRVRGDFGSRGSISWTESGCVSRPLEYSR